ncbi:MAG TPA: hypothetical protein ENI39_07630 [Anaerolineae bacterium]|nr:hypothetical protein [Anaerolineae bacterium]
MVRHVGNKTFILREDVWTDTTFDPETMAPVQVGFGTEAYFDLLAARPEWGEYLALGSRTLFVAEGTAYEVVEGETGPVDIPPTRTTTPTEEVAEPVVEEPVQEEPGGRLCLGAGMMIPLALAAAMVWQRLRTPTSAP